jgi:hypothetical protein
VALVRCTCVVDLRVRPGEEPVLTVTVADPECNYIVHRIEAS